MYKIAVASDAGRDEFEGIVFPRIHDSEGSTTKEVTPNSETSVTKYKPSNLPKFSLRYYLTNLLLKTSDPNVLIPLGDFLLALCKDDVDTFVDRVGLGYAAGVLQRKGSLAEIMSRQGVQMM